MKVYLVEAWDRPGRLSRLLGRAQHLAAARSMAMEKGGNQKWVELGQRAGKAARIHYTFSAQSSKVDPTLRRHRLAVLAQTARRGFAASDGGRANYWRAAKALAIYQKKRYDPLVRVRQELTPKGQVFDPSMRLVKTQHSYNSETRRVVPLHIQRRGTKRVFLPHPPSEHPAHALARVMARRIGKSADQSARKFGVDPTSPKAQEIKGHLQRSLVKKFMGPHYELPPAPKDRSRTLPKHATWDLTKRIAHPMIRRARVRKDPIAMGTWGPHPAAWLVRKPIGRREIRSVNQWLRGDRG